MEDPRPTDAELCQVVAYAIKNFGGNAETLKGAIGYAFFTRRIGWKPALLMHTQRTVRAYDKILGIDSRTFFQEVGPDAGRTLAWRSAEKISNFWKAVKGEVKGVRSTEIAPSDPKGS